MSQRSGLFYAILAYLIWGIFPLYWALFHTMDPYFIFICRCVWVFPFLLMIMIGRGELKDWLDLFTNRVSLIRTFACAALIGLNWFVYIAGIQQHHIVELGLGYFLSPIFSVLLGVTINHDRLGKWRSIAVSFVVVGSIIYGLQINGIPNYALGIAGSFSLYGFLRKRQPHSAVVGQGGESAILAVVGLIWFASGRISTVGYEGTPLDLALVISAGLVTVVPLLMFAFAAHNLEISTLGMLNFITPTIKIFVACYFLNEPFGKMDWVAMLTIWVGLGFYLFGLFRSSRAQAPIVEGTP